MRRLLIAVVMLATMAAQADDIVYTWTHATTRTDGSAITGARSYVISVQRTGAPAIELTATGTTATAANLDPGTYSAKIATVEAGRAGPWSAPVVATITAPPAAPGSLKGVTVTINVTIGQ